MGARSWSGRRRAGLGGAGYGVVMSEPLVVAPDRLSADEIAQVLALVEAAAAADGVHPLSEQTMLALRAGEPGLLARFGSESSAGSGARDAEPAEDPENAEDPE